jgi:hypothetical protein
VDVHRRARARKARKELSGPRRTPGPGSRLNRSPSLR